MSTKPSIAANQVTLLHKQNSVQEVADLLSRSKKLNHQKDTKAIDFAYEALALALENNLSKEIIIAYVEMAIYYCKTRCDFDKSIELCEQGLDQKTEDYPELYAELHRLLGINYHHLGKLEDAQKHYIESAATLENLSSLSAKSIEDMAGVYHNLAILYKDYDEKGLSKEYIDKALLLYESIDSQKGMALCYNTLAGQCATIGNYDEAIELHTKAYSIREQLNDRMGMSVSLNNIGLIYASKKNFDDAIDYLKKSLAIKEEFGNNHVIAITLYCLGDTYKEKGDLENAMVVLTNSAKLLRNLNANLELLNVLTSLIDTYEKLGDYEKAFHTQKEFVQTKESVLNLEKAKAIIETQERFESEKKEQEKEIFRLKHIELAEYADKLESSNQELQQFAYVASHDLREPLRMITSYMMLLESKLSAKLSDDEKMFVHFAIDGAKRMDALINDLLSLSRLNSPTNHEKVDLNDVASAATRNLETLIKERNALVEIDNLPVVMGNYIQLTQLLQNLISNGIKYNKSEEPTIKITCKRERMHYCFHVEDNGIGIPEEKREQVFIIFKRLHTREEYSGTGIGLSICKKIVERHNGKIWVDSSSLGGSNFIFCLPF
jgi:signal transduction histidine kinase